MPRVLEETDNIHKFGRPQFLNSEEFQTIDDEYLGKRKIVQDWFFCNSFQTSILESLRGQGGASPNSFIQSYTLGSEELPETGVGSIAHSNVITMNILSRLTPGKNEPLTAGNSEENGEQLEQFPFTVRFDGVRRRHVIEYPNYKSRETVQKLLIDQVNIVKQALTDVTREEINENLFTALTAGYDATSEGKMPLACRTVVGLKDNYAFNSGETWVKQIATAIPVDTNKNNVDSSVCMSVAHIRKLRDFAMFNPYNAAKVGTGLLQGGILPFDFRPHFILLIDQAARERLIQDQFFRETYLTNSRSLPSNRLINPVDFGDFLGTIFGVDVYHCPFIDLYRKKGILAKNLPLTLSYGVLLGASSLVEGYGFTDFIETTENRSGKRIELSYEYVHGASAPRFPAYFSPLFNEKDAVNGGLISIQDLPAIQSGSKTTFGMPEVGIIHSITLNQVLADWSA